MWVGFNVWLIGRSTENVLAVAEESLGNKDCGLFACLCVCLFVLRSLSYLIVQDHMPLTQASDSNSHRIGFPSFYFALFLFCF